MNAADTSDPLAAAMARILAPLLLERLAGPLASAVAKELHRSQAAADELLTPRQARALKRCSMKVLLAALRSGALPAETRAGKAEHAGTIAGQRRWLIRRADVLKWNP